MDKYIDQIFSSSLWADGDSKERSSRGYCEIGQPNLLLPISLRLYENNKGIISSTKSGDDQSQSQKEDEKNCNYGKASPIMNSCLKIGNMGLQYDTDLGSLNFNYPKLLPVVDELTSSPSFTEAGNVGNNGNDMQNLSSIPQLCPSVSYEGVSSVMEQDIMQQFSLKEGNLEDEMDLMGKRYVCLDQILQLDKLSNAVTTKDKEDLQSYPLSSITAGPSVTMATNGVSFLSQTSSAAPAGGCNGNGKPRVRARRGQATDPHSIAERLRREKIAERMKNLQELVPNSSKSDKASMLDEIIEYVKFLQLQVKVLSMSRLGAAGAVIPLITDGRAEGSNSLKLSPSTGLSIDVSPSPDQIAFEEEVLKLLESDVTAAIQYLQSKGLCLMPMALAAAISSGKASLSGVASEEKKKFSFSNGLDNSNNYRGSRSSSSSSSSCSFSGIETHQISLDGNIMTEKLSSKGTIANGSNGIVEQEKANNIFSREMKPKTVL